MNELHLFAGVGGGILGGMLLGHTPVCAVEINPYRRGILLQRQRGNLLPKFPIWDDIKTFNGTPWKGKVELLSGGFPCQQFSSAARGRLVAEDLWPEMLRVVGEVRPRLIFAENVSHKAIEKAALDLGLSGNYRTRTTTLAASSVGADHKRNRWWLLAHSNDQEQLHLPKYAEVAGVPSVHRHLWGPETFSQTWGMDDGSTNRVDRLKAIGDGQVPWVAAVAFARLYERMIEGDKVGE